MNVRSSSGFTLIEIIIAMVIIGIIVAISTVSFSAVRNNSNDKAIQSNLSAIQLRAELYYRDNGEYVPSSNGYCSWGMFQDPMIAQALAAVDDASPRGIGTYGIHCRSSENFYGIWVQRPDGSETPYWCADSRQQSCGVMLGSLQTPTYSPCDCVEE